MKSGIVTFAGAGPGAPDLITVRGRNAIAAADVIVYAGSLVNPELLELAAADCRIYDSATMSLEEILAVLVEAASANLKVLRLHTGDPAMYGAIAEQMSGLDAAGIDYEIIPGVSSVFAAAAAVKAELTQPGITQTVILGRRAGRTPVPGGESLVELARHNASMALYLSVGGIDAVVSDLCAGGYAADTAAAVVYRASWPDEKIVRGTLATIGEAVKAAGIGRQALILVGNALRRAGTASRLYAADFAHGYRAATVARTVATSATAALPQASRPRFRGKIAVYALTEDGSRLAISLAAALEARAYISTRHVQSLNADPDRVEFFAPGQFENVIGENFCRFQAHIFVMATGIVVRKLAALLVNKVEDPAVVVCDEKGDFAISLVSGHIGGANQLARQVAALTGGQAVVTTATDVQQLPAFDTIAAQRDWKICNPENIKLLNTLLLARQIIGVAWPEDVFDACYHNRQHIVRLIKGEAPPPAMQAAVVFLEDLEQLNLPPELPVLCLQRPLIVLGIGCNRGTSADAIAEAVDNVLAQAALQREQVAAVATIDLKRDELGLLAFISRHGWQLSTYTAAELAQIDVPNPSSTVQQVTGTASVAEAAALRRGGGGAMLLVEKVRHGDITVAVAQLES